MTTKRGRPPIGDEPMTNAERSRRHREKIAELRVNESSAKKNLRKVLIQALEKLDDLPDEKAKEIFDIYQKIKKSADRNTMTGKQLQMYILDLYQRKIGDGQ